MVQAEMVTVTISCPTTWHARVKWMEDNCPEMKDGTNWGMWQIGQDDIYLTVNSLNATMYYLIWG